MNFYNNTHPYYCGIDLHAKTLYVCIIDQQGNACVHKEIQASPTKLQNILEPFLGSIVVGVECMHCWYWVSDFCEEMGVDFILGHALYMKAIHGGKAKNDRIDSFKIASLMRGGNFPLAYVYPKHMRATRDLLRRRMKLVRHGANLKAHVVNTTSQYNLTPNKVNLKFLGCIKPSLTKEQADKAEMDNRKTKGELVPVIQAAKLLEKVVLAFRSQILALPTKAAPHVHGCRAIAETKEALETSLHDALNELAELDVSRLGSR